jgi:hypothetical protein
MGEANPSGGKVLIHLSISEAERIIWNSAVQDNAQQQIDVSCVVDAHKPRKYLRA